MNLCDMTLIHCETNFNLGVQMLKVLTAFLIVLSSSAFSQESSVELNKCFSKVKRHYFRNSAGADSMTKEKYLPAGEALKGFQGKDIAKFEEDVLVYMGTGSYHSGYFQDYIIASPANCEVLEIINIYSE